jgi:hypothetical protein
MELLGFLGAIIGLIAALLNRKRTIVYKFEHPESAVNAPSSDIPDQAVDNPTKQGKDFDTPTSSPPVGEEITNKSVNRSLVFYVLRAIASFLVFVVSALLSTPESIIFPLIGFAAIFFAAYNGLIVVLFTLRKLF